MRGHAEIVVMFYVMDKSPLVCKYPCRHRGQTTQSKSPYPICPPELPLGDMRSRVGHDPTGAVDLVCRKE